MFLSHIVPHIVCRAYPILNIECHAFVLPLSGLNKIRELHFQVMDGRITDEEEVHGVVMLVQKVSVVLPDHTMTNPLPAFSPPLFLPSKVSLIFHEGIG